MKQVVCPRRETIDPLVHIPELHNEAQKTPASIGLPAISKLECGTWPQGFTIGQQFLGWKGANRVCASVTVGGWMHHLVFECLVLQCLREQWPHLFEGPQPMQAFMWQYDLIGVAMYTMRAY